MQSSKSSPSLLFPSLSLFSHCFFSLHLPLFRYCLLSSDLSTFSGKRVSLLRYCTVLQCTLLLQVAAAVAVTEARSRWGNSRATASPFSSRRPAAAVVAGSGPGRRQTRARDSFPISKTERERDARGEVERSETSGREDGIVSDYRSKRAHIHSLRERDRDERMYHWQSPGSVLLSGLTLSSRSLLALPPFLFRRSICRVCFDLIQLD